MFYINKALLLVFVCCFTLQRPIINAMIESTNNTSEFQIGKTRAQMKELLRDEKRLDLQMDLRYKFKSRQKGTTEWVKSHNDILTPSSHHDPLMLYYELNNLHKLAHNSEGGLDEVTTVRAYLIYIFLAIILYSDAYAGKVLGFEKESAWAFQFLMTKIKDKWLDDINNHPFNINFQEDIINRIKKVVLSKNGVNETFINSLHSPAWISCCSDSSWNRVGFYKNTFYFGQPDKTRLDLFNSEENKASIKLSRKHALEHIMKVLEQLQAQNIVVSISEFSQKTFYQILELP